MRWLIAITVCACGSKDATPPPPPPAPVRIDQLPQPALDLPKQQSFRLLEPGTGERLPLRYRIGDPEITTRITMTLTSRHGDGSSSTLAPIETGFATAANGANAIRVRVLPGTITGDATDEARGYLTPWKASEGRRLTLGFDARGQLGPLAFTDDPASARSSAPLADLTQRLLAIAIPVPDESVGVGAKWRVVTALVQPPVVVKQTATYTLLERTPAGWKVGVELQRVGEEQTIPDPEAMIDLVALVRTYTGTLVIAPDHALPTGTLAIESSMHLRIQPRTGPVTEQVLDDKGSVVLSSSPP